MEQQKTAEMSGQGEHYLVARRRKRRRAALIVTVLAAAAAGGWYWHQSQQVAPEDQPLVVAVGYGDIENTIASAGELAPSRVVDVGAQVSGQLQRLYVDVGDFVEEGQMLAKIDARVQENRVRSSRASINALRAQVEAREASLELARENYERQQNLWDEDATSKLDWQNARNSLLTAEASLEQLKAQIEQSEASLATDETQLEFTEIMAPISGTVVEVLLTEGVTLNASQQVPTVLRIADLSEMTVETQISEADIGRLKEDMDVYFTTLGGGDRRWYGTLEQFLPSPLIENNVVLYTGLFKVDNSDGALRIGMTTQVYFVTSAARDVLTVPVGALTYLNEPGGMGPAGRSGGAGIPAGRGGPSLAARKAPAGGAEGVQRAMVKVVHDDGTVEEREILVGVTSRVSAEVVSGIRAGERVIAGIIQAEAPQTESGNNNNDRGFRGPPGMRFF